MQVLLQFVIGSEVYVLWGLFLFLNTSLDDLMNFHDLCIIDYDTLIDGASLHIQCLEREKGVRNLR